MKLQNILDLSTFEITRFRIWNQTSQPSDKGLGSKYFNTNSGHDAYGREQIYTPMGWRTAAYMDDIEAINEKLDLIFGDEIDTDTIIDSWKEVQNFLAGINDTTTLITLLDDKLSKSNGGIVKGRLTIGNFIQFDRFEEGKEFLLGQRVAGGALEYYNGSAWKVLAFTDSDITGNAATATKASRAFELGTKNGGLIYAYAYEADAFMTLGRNNYTAYLDGSSVVLRSGSSLKQGLILNSSGNVTIGSSDKLGTSTTTKLYVDGGIRFAPRTIWGNTFNGTADIENSNLILYKNPSDYTEGWARSLRVLDSADNILGQYGFWGAGDALTYMYMGKSYNNAWLVINPSGNVGIGTTTPQYKLDVAGEGRFTGLANLNGGALIPTGKKMMFGDASGNAIMEYDEDAGAIRVLGNLYATGTVASGGKAQEGTGTGGSATVYPFTLTYGQAAYQIANPKSTTNVIVQVYEWNATTSSWDLILTDVNVTASKITVTFGRTTTVNHMVTVV